MDENFLFGLKFNFDESDFLRGSSQAQDQLEKTVAAIISARQKTQKEVESLAAALSKSPEQVKAALNDLAKAERDQQADSERRAAIAERRRVEQQRREMDALRERTQAVTTLRDSLLSLAAITIGGSGVAGIMSLATGTARNGVAERSFAERTGTNVARNMGEEEGAYLSGLSTRDEARQSIGVYAQSQNEYGQTGRSNLSDTLIRNGIQIGPSFFREGHEAALRDVVEQMRHLGYDRQRQAFLLEQSGLTSGGYTNLALHPDEMARFNRLGEARTRSQASQIEQDLQFQQSWNNMVSMMDKFRSDIGHIIEPWIVDATDMVKKLDDIAKQHPELAREILGATAVIVALGGLFSAALTIIGPVMAIRAALGVAGVAAGGGAAASAGGVGLSPWLLALGGAFIPSGQIKNENAGILTPTASGATRIPTSQQEANRKQAQAYWQSQGWGDAQTAALSARFNIESGFDPFAIGDGGAAFGIGQWHSDRQANYLKLFGHTMQSVTDRAQALREQLQFSQWEMTNTDGKNAGGLVAATLREAKNSDQAADIVSRMYIRPGRTQYAQSQESVRTQLLARNYLPGLHPPISSAGSVTNNHSAPINITGPVNVRANNPEEFGRQMQHLRSAEAAVIANAGQF